jgi:uncharacterized protein YdaU (DUF1376 family)
MLFHSELILSFYSIKNDIEILLYNFFYEHNNNIIHSRTEEEVIHKKNAL